MLVLAVFLGTGADVDRDRDFGIVNGVEARCGALDGPGPAPVDGMVRLVSGSGSFGFVSGYELLAFAIEERRE